MKKKKKLKKSIQLHNKIAIFTILHRQWKHTEHVSKCNNLSSPTYLTGSIHHHPKIIKTQNSLINTLPFIAKHNISLLLSITTLSMALTFFFNSELRAIVKLMLDKKK